LLVSRSRIAFWLSVKRLSARACAWVWLADKKTLTTAAASRRAVSGLSARVVILKNSVLGTKLVWMARMIRSAGRDGPSSWATCPAKDSLRINSA